MFTTSFAPDAYSAQILAPFVGSYHHQEGKPFNGPAFIPARRATKLKRANEAEENLAWLLHDKGTTKRTLYKMRQCRALLRLACELDKPACNRARFFAFLEAMPTPSDALHTRNCLRLPALKLAGYDTAYELRKFRILYRLDLLIAAR